MARSLSGLLALAAFAAIPWSVARAQPAGGVLPPALAALPTPRRADAEAESPLAATLRDVAPGVLPPPTQPRTDLPSPVYLQPDPLLDAPDLYPLGCFGAVEATFLVPHVRYWSNMKGPVFLNDGTADAVSVPGAHLDGTVAPHLMAGYRLPAGFGEFVVGYRFFSTSGDQTLPGPDGPSNVRTRLQTDLADFEYASSEFSLWPKFDMRWHIGGRYGDLYTDSRQTTPFAPAAAGTGVTDRHVVDRFNGFGPHFGLELAHFVSSVELVARVDGSFLFGRIHQSFGETTTAAGPGGLPANGNTAFDSSQEVPILNVQVGARWKPSANFELFAGYQYEHWWEVGRLGRIDTQGEMYSRGLVARAGFHY